MIANHLEGPVAAEPWIQTVEYDPEIRRWYVRFGCEGRDAATIYFDLHQRTLRYELYFMPDPPKNRLELYEWLLHRNHTIYGAKFSLGPDGDVYLVGRLALEHLTEWELDRIIGVLFELHILPGHGVGGSVGSLLIMSSIVLAFGAAYWMLGIGVP